MKEFKNEPLVDFSHKANVEKMKRAIERVNKDLGQEYEIVIKGEKIKTPEKFKSLNPCRKDEVVGIFQKGTPELVQKAIEVASATFKTWQFVPAKERANYLFKAADICRKKRFELDAWMIIEVGKSWVEADADVAEAIDFLDFYAWEALRYSDEQPLTKLAGEKNELSYLPLGVGVIISPWNFPFAILAGMASAAIVSGNTVILKPSSDAPRMGSLFVEIMEEAGLPRGVLNFLTGSGATVGDVLIDHPQTRFIAFTGSKEVGLRINERAAKVSGGQIWIKRLIAEMGGKDSIIVDSDSDLDEAVKGVVSSAFGFQGQKCSACSRAIVLEDIYDDFLINLVDETKKIKMGDTRDQANSLGAVINNLSFQKILRYIEIGEKEGRLMCGGTAENEEGYFIKPTIFSDVDPEATISQEEIFGPVLAVIKAQNYDQALEIANNTEYGLTGSVYTHDRKKIEKAKKLFQVGNLYFNRKCTGALVGVHPFGGFNMSGTDSKAGGRDYLLLFLQAKLISEKIK